VPGYFLDYTNTNPSLLKLGEVIFVVFSSILPTHTHVHNLFGRSCIKVQKPSIMRR